MALLGFGSPYDDKMTSLLGIDPSAARQQALWNGIAQMGAALMGTRNMGLVGGAFLNGINKGKEDYLANAYDAYRIKTAADDKAYQRGLDKQQQANWEKGFGLQQKSAARADEQLRMQMEEQQRLIDQRNAQQDYVTGWMGNADQKGANLLPQGIRTMARQHGVEGVLSPADEQRYNNAAPFVGAQDYGSAFNQIAAQPEAQNPNWKEANLEDGVYWVDQNDPSNKIKIGDRPDRNEGEGRGFTQEKQLRSEYTTEAKPFTELRTNFQKIDAASKDQTGASDIALVYSFMKMLDPTSVVREGEFATAEQAGGIDSRVVSLYNRVINGERLSPQVRQQFAQQASRQYEQQYKTYQKIKSKYDQLAKQYGLDPSRVAPDITYGVSVQPSSANAPTVDDLVNMYSSPR